MARSRARAARRVPAGPVPGQLGLFGSAEPWQPTRDCRCWPPALRGCHHCPACDTCQDCHRCAGAGCTCACDTENQMHRGYEADRAEYAGCMDELDAYEAADQAE